MPVVLASEDRVALLGDPAVAQADAIDAACRNLRLSTMLGQFGELADTAARNQMTYRGFLVELPMAECDANPAVDRRPSTPWPAASGPAKGCRCV